MLANMLVPQSDLPHLPDQSATGCSYAWLAACAPSIVIFWILIRRWVSSQPHHSHWNRNLLGEVNNARETCVYPAMDPRSASLDWKKDFTKQSDSGSSFRLVFILGLCVLYGFFLLGHLPLDHSFLQDSHPLVRWSSVTSTSTALQTVFQVYHPVPFNSSGDSGCDVVVLLMDHVFGASYGAPFVGHYEPPSCKFDTVRINLTVSSRGRQYDRLASMYLGDHEVFRTSTAEPTKRGILWTYVKEMSQYDYLWKNPQTLIFDLGNLITDVYTGSFNATMTAHFSYENNVRTADLILPISARKSAASAASAFQFPADNTTVRHTIPAAVSRAIVSVSACGQSTEEFWWSNVFTGDTKAFGDTVGELYGYTPFREIQLYIDGTLAGLVWPFPIIFTGGVAPGLWRPIVGIDAFDLREPEIDISPFLPMIQDDKQHSFEIRITGLDVSADGNVTFSNTVGSYWVVTGNIFLYYGGEVLASDPSAVHQSKRPNVEAPMPTFAVSRNLLQHRNGGNESLAYTITAERSFKATSSRYSWSQTLSFTNNGLLTRQGYNQVNAQITTGNNTVMRLGDNHPSNSVTFKYPLLVNSSYGTAKNELTIDAWMERGLDFESTGGYGVSTYTHTSGPSYLHTKQTGAAQYKSVAGGNSSSWGDTQEEFESEMNGAVFQRTVLASNGTLVGDTHPQSEGLALSDQNETGRDSVRAMLGRGPGSPSDRGQWRA